VGADRRTIHRWCAAESLPSRAHQEQVEKLLQLRYLLGASFRDQKAILEWLHKNLDANADPQVDFRSSSCHLPVSGVSG
jgi:hypothetical protein